MITKTLPAATTTTITIPCPTFKGPSDVVFEIVGLGGSTLSVTPQIRVAPQAAGTGTSALYNVAYRDHAAKSDVTAGVAITAAGVYKVEADGCDLVLAVAVGAGTGATLNYVQLGVR